METHTHLRARHLQIGFGSAGVINQGTQAPALSRLQLSERLVVARDLATVLEGRGAQKIGQNRTELDSPEIPVAEHSLAKDVGAYVASDEWADALTRARARVQANVLQATAGVVEHRPAQPGPEWIETDVALRVIVRTPST